jgi:diguanylate cyclase (GGDEF)-like protein
MSLLWIVPVVMVVAAFTNPLHRLVWTVIEPSELYPFVYRYGHGPLFWLGVAYQYALILVSFALVVVGAVRRRGIYRQQALMLLVGLSIAVLGNLLYVSGALNRMPLDVTPLTLAVATGFLLAGVSRAQLLDMLPAARHRIVDMMPDGLMVLDAEMRLVDWNPAALRLWHIDDEHVQGRHVSELVPGWTDAIPADPPASFHVALQQGDEDSVCHHIDAELARLAASPSRTDGWVVLFHDSTELRGAELRLQDANNRLEALNRELVRQAIHDSLTGLYNRSYLDEALPRELARAARDGKPVGLLILDVDRFKEVNDRHGHGVGDAALVRVAELVRAQVRAGDMPCRYGGDELVAVMPGATREEALGVGERIRASVEADVLRAGEPGADPPAAGRRRAGAPAADPSAADGPGANAWSMRLTVSVGVAVFPTDAADAGELFRQADRALYAAKELGRNRIHGVVHDESV